MTRKELIKNLKQCEKCLSAAVERAYDDDNLDHGENGAALVEKLREVIEGIDEFEYVHENYFKKKSGAK